MKTYSEDLRRSIVKARSRGMSAEEVAKLFSVSKRSVERYWKAHGEGIDHGQAAGRLSAIPTGQT